MYQFHFIQAEYKLSTSFAVHAIPFYKKYPYMKQPIKFFNHKKQQPIEFFKIRNNFFINN